MKNGITNPKWKYRIIFAIVSGLAFTALLYLFDLITTEKTQTINGLIFQGIFFAVFFGLGFPYFFEKFGRKFISRQIQNINPQLAVDEHIEMEIPANLFRGIEGVGGKVFLTDKKLIFKGHKLNIQNKQTNIDYTEITDIVKQKTVKIIDNGIRIKTKDGKKYDFVVDEREKWFEKLHEKIK